DVRLGGRVVGERDFATGGDRDLARGHRFGSRAGGCPARPVILDTVFVDFELRFGRASSESWQHGHRCSNQRSKGEKQKRGHSHCELTFLGLGWRRYSGWRIARIGFGVFGGGVYLTVSVPSIPAIRCPGTEQ